MSTATNADDDLFDDDDDKGFWEGSMMHWAGYALEALRRKPKNWRDAFAAFTDLQRAENALECALLDRWNRQRREASHA